MGRPETVIVPVLPVISNCYCRSSCSSYIFVTRLFPDKGHTVSSENERKRILSTRGSAVAFFIILSHQRIQRIQTHTLENQWWRGFCFLVWVSFCVYVCVCLCLSLLLFLGFLLVYCSGYCVDLDPIIRGENEKIFAPVFLPSHWRETINARWTCVCAWIQESTARKPKNQRLSFLCLSLPLLINLDLPLTERTERDQSRVPQFSSSTFLVFLNNNRGRWGSFCWALSLSLPLLNRSFLVFHCVCSKSRLVDILADLRLFSLTLFSFLFCQWALLLFTFRTGERVS